jgi:hypothetical protein
MLPRVARRAANAAAPPRYTFFQPIRFNPQGSPQMQTFKDTEAREWQLSINMGSARRAKEATGFDLLDNSTGLAMASLADDLNTLVSVLYALVKPQADGRGLTEEQFADALSGDTLDSATEALLAAYCDFLPAASRAVVQQAIDQARELHSQMVAAMQAKLTEFSTPEAVAAYLASAVSESKAQTAAASTAAPATVA